MCITCYSAFNIFQKVISLHGAFLRRSKFANLCHVQCKTFCYTDLCTKVLIYLVALKKKKERKEKKKLENFHFSVVKMPANYAKIIQAGILMPANYAKIFWMQVFNKFHFFKMSEIFTLLLLNISNSTSVIQHQ